MSHDSFQDREQALENHFFSEVDKQLLAKLKAQLATKDAAAALADVSGIRDESVLADLVQAGVTPENFAALSLVPLVEVAWSDGAVTGQERDAVLKAAAESGLTSASASYPMLKSWLENRPGMTTVQAWKEYAAALAKTLPEDQLTRLRGEIISRAKAIAESSGGFLGFGSKISVMEQKALKEFEEALSK